MEPTGAVQQVWIFLKESDQWQHRTLFLAVLELLRREGVTGATVLRGLAGYGARGQIHTATLVELGSDLPIVVTFVDRTERIERVMPRLTEMVQVGLISVTPATVIATRRARSVGRATAGAAAAGARRACRDPRGSPAPRRRRHDTRSRHPAGAHAAGPGGGR